MRAHPFNRQMRFSGVGRAQNGNYLGAISRHVDTLSADVFG
jgi:hypothetical protein